MKKIVSVSLGSASRNKTVTLELGGEEVLIKRVGTDGDKGLARALFKQLDGQVDALGVGGTDLYIYADEKAYPFKDSFHLIKDVQRTPVVDGSGIKQALEPLLVHQLAQEGQVEFRNKRVLHMCGVDRFALGKALVEEGAQVTFGDLVYGVGINWPLRNIGLLKWLARMVVPIITRLPIDWFYPTGDKQNVREQVHPEYFQQADIIVGDFLFIKKFMPEKLEQKIIITNTVTEEDRQQLQAAGVAKLITITPEFEGRSFGTNVLEALLVALAGSKQPLSREQYGKLMSKYKLQASIVEFGKVS